MRKNQITTHVQCGNSHVQCREIVVSHCVKIKVSLLSGANWTIVYYLLWTQTERRIRFAMHRTHMSAKGKNRFEGDDASLCTTNMLMLDLFVILRLALIANIQTLIAFGFSYVLFVFCSHFSAYWNDIINWLYAQKHIAIRACRNPGPANLCFAN